jgi:hypothetical protein
MFGADYVTIVVLLSLVCSIAPSWTEGNDIPDNLVIFKRGREFD